MNIKAMIRAGLIKKPRRPRRVRPVKPSRRAELAYQADLLEVCAAIRGAVERDLLPVLRRTEAEYSRPAVDGATTDRFAGDIMAALENMARAFGLIDSIAARLAHAAVQRVHVETEVQLARNLTNVLGVDMRPTIAMLNVQPQIEAATVANTQLVKSLPKQFVAKIEPMVLNNVQRGVRYETMAAEIQAQLGATEGRAKLIARDQMAKVNSSINEAKQNALGIDKYEWSTSGDERVRPDHAANEGKVFSWSSPPKTGHPGEDIQCRCVAIPVIDFEDGD